MSATKTASMRQQIGRMKLLRQTPMKQTEEKPPPITQLPMGQHDLVIAERVAERLGYKQTAYTSTSGLWGLYCLAENPETWHGNPQALRSGCVIKTAQFGFMFVADLEDLGMHDLAQKAKHL